jgi:predicted phage terminase large subunit-like protein
VLTISPLEMIDHLVDDPTRRQTAADEWVEKLCDLIRRWQPQCWGVESGQIKSAIGPYLRKRMIERSAYCRLKEFPSRYDKAIRARSIQDRMATSELLVPTKAPWFTAFREQLLQFPVGKYDDQVDALSLIGQMLERLAPGQPADPEPEFLDMTRPVYLHPNGRFSNTLTLEDLWQAAGR